MRHRAKVSTLGIIGGLLVLLMVAATACEDSRTETTPETTGTPQGSTNTETPLLTDAPSPGSTKTPTAIANVPPTTIPTLAATGTPTLAPTPTYSSPTTATSIPGSTATPEPTHTLTPTSTYTPTPSPDPRPTATPSPSPTAPTPTAEQTALSHLLEIVPWFDGQTSGADSRLRDTVVGIWLHDPAIGEAVALMPWVADRASENEARVVSALRDIAFTQTDVAKLTVGLPWVVDGIDSHEAQAMERLRDILSDAPVPARRVFNLNWVMDDISTSEAAVIDSFARLAAEDADILSQAVELPWIADGATESDSSALAWFVGSFAVHSAETAKLVVEYFWFADGVTHRERELLRHLAALAESDPEAAQLIANLIWVRDGINAIEADALNDLRSLVVNHPDLARQLLGYAWMVNDVTYPEQESLYSISRIARRDRTLAALVASFPWVSERVEMTSIQRDPLYFLGVVADRELALARELANFLDGRLTRQKTEMVRTISYMMLEARDSFALLADQPWFNDGLDEEDAAFLSTLGAIHRVSPGLYEDFVETRFTQSRRVNLPLAGEVGIWVFQNAPFQPDEDLLGPMEEGIRNIEGFMGVPFPADRVIMVSVVRDPDGHYDIAAGQHGSGHIQVVRSESAPLRESVLFHEQAHFYYNFFPIWLLEGGAEFMTAIVRDRTGVESLAARGQVAAARVESNCYPAGFNNLYELDEKQGFYVSDGPDGCNYPFGEYFLIRLTELLGEDAVSAALRSLYLLIHSDERSFPLTGKDIYLAFLNNTPADLTGEFRDLFRMVHGGPWVDAVVDVPDDHGDDAAAATEILVGQVVEGTMDHEFDIDAFAFDADEGVGYRIIFEGKQGLDLDKEERNDFHLTLRTAEGGAQERLRSHGSRIGVDERWTAPQSGGYVLAVESADGKIGTYRLEILRFVIGEDDHGDDPRSATVVTAGEDVIGSIDHGADVDYFEVHVTGGYGYEVEVVNHTLEYSRVIVYGPDGAAGVDGGGKGWGLYGSDSQWRAPTTGNNYITVESPFGRTGSYLLTLTEVVPGGDDHGDALGATAITLGRTVDGTLGHSFDLDYFRFAAESGLPYNIRITHLTTFHQPVIVFAPDGTTAVHQFWPYSPQSRGSHIPWVAPATGDYFLKIWSPDGDTGDYQVFISHAAPDADDHGDSSLSATAIAVGDVTPGRLDKSDDFDFFRIQVEEGHQYLIEVTFRGIDDPRLSLHAPDGITPEFRFVDRGDDFRYWVAPESGDYFVVIWSATGGAGGYELAVSAVK